MTQPNVPLLELTEADPNRKKYPSHPARGLLRWLVSTLILGSILVLIFCGWAWFRYGSLAAFDTHLIQGNALFVESAAGEPVEVCAGERAEVGVVLQNLDNEPLTVYGIQTSCSCIVTEEGDCPFDLPAAGRRDLVFRIQTAESEAGTAIERMAVLYAEPPGKPVSVPLRLRVL